MLTVHHLGKSQSERVVWLCEELGIPYELKRYERMPNNLSPPELKALHPLGAAPVITDGPFMLAESAAVVEYIIEKYGNGRLKLLPTDGRYADYLYWFHFANGNLQPAVMRKMVIRRASPDPQNPAMLAAAGRLDLILDLLENRLGEASYLAGNEFTAADIMLVFSLTTMRLFYPFDLKPYPNILAYLGRIGSRESYQRAMRKGDPGIAPVLS